MSQSKMDVATMDDLEIRTRLLDLDFFLLAISLVLFSNAMLELLGVRLS